MTTDLPESADNASKFDFFKIPYGRLGDTILFLVVGTPIPTREFAASCSKEGFVMWTGFWS